MASTINVLTTGVGGIQQTGDTSGILQMQKDGTATMTINATGLVGIGGIATTGLLEIFAQDAIRIKGYQPLQTWIDTNDANKGVRISTASAIMAFSNDTTGGGTYAERFRIGAAGDIGLGGANYGTSGQFLKSNGPGAAATWGTAGGGFSNMTVFTSPGTFTTPASTTQIKVTVVGGGGGGASATSFTSGSGGGGGGGAIYVGPVSASTGYAVTVGTGGGAAGTGNTSSFGALASATGGGGGSAPGPGSYAYGGAGGSGSAGTLQFKGGYGGTNGPAGGVAPAGIGGSSYFGGGGGGGAPSGIVNGTAGQAYGGGGGGGQFSGGTGGAGGAGVVVVEY